MPDQSAEPVPSLGASYLANVPQSVRDEIDRALLDTPDGQVSIAEVHRRFRLKDKYTVSLTTFRRYVHRLQRDDRLRALASAADGRSGPPPDPIDIDYLQRNVQLLALQNLVRTLNDTELTTAELCTLTRVFIAYRKLQLETLKLAEGPLPDADALDSLEQRIQYLILEQLVRALEDGELTPAETCSLTRAFIGYRKVQLDTQKLAATMPATATASPGLRARSSPAANGDSTEASATVRKRAECREYGTTSSRRTPDLTPESSKAEAGCSKLEADSSPRPAPAPGGLPRNSEEFIRRVRAANEAYAADAAISRNNPPP